MSRYTPGPELDLPARDGEVEVGERVTVLDLMTGAVSDYRVVDTDAPRTAVAEISRRRRLGAALLGRHVGDVVEVLRSGRTVRLEIVEIDG
jgi:transcription elongation GreA/GreB family factor